MRREDPGRDGRRGNIRDGVAVRGGGRPIQCVAVWTGGPSRGRLLLLKGTVSDAVRKACRQGLLICPVPGCPAPRFMAVGGTVSPHFRHYKGAAGHGDESEIHLQAKAVIADWASRCVTGAEVAVERRSGARRPDVHVSSSAAGWTTAIEYQRSELPADLGRRSWAARQDALAGEHDQVIWLLGPILVTGHPSNPRGVVASELMYAMARRGLPIRVLDIATNRVTSIVPWLQGVALLKRKRVQGGFIGTSARKHFIAFLYALDACRLVDGAMQTPIDRQLSDLGLTHQLELAHDPKRAPAARPRRWEPVPHFR